MHLDVWHLASTRWLRILSPLGTAVHRASAWTGVPEQKAQGSIGHHRGGNTVMMRRTCMWSKALRSSFHEEDAPYPPISGGTNRSVGSVEATAGGQA
jgi:hypothetical protein